MDNDAVINESWKINNQPMKIPYLKLQDFFSKFIDTTEFVSWKVTMYSLKFTELKINFHYFCVCENRTIPIKNCNPLLNIINGTMSPIRPVEVS
jgi:hypothetical protein